MQCVIVALLARYICLISGCISGLNPFMPNGFSHLYQLNEFISNFRVIFFTFIQILKETSVCKHLET